jgi:hypothetical protein
MREDVDAAACPYIARVWCIAPLDSSITNMAGEKHWLLIRPYMLSALEYQTMQDEQSDDPEPRHTSQHLYHQPRSHELLDDGSRTAHACKDSQQLNLVKPVPSHVGFTL